MGTLDMTTSLLCHISMRSVSSPKLRYVKAITWKVSKIVGDELKLR